MIVGAYHVATFVGWQDIFDEQVASLVDSGLITAADNFTVGVVGDPNVDLRHIRSSLPSATVVHHGPVSLYEFPTLMLLRQLAETHRSAKCVYLHTKGVSSRSAGADRHRRNMQSVVVERWRQCVRELDGGFDACGASWQADPWPHFSGNFWWATARYIRSLPEPFVHPDRYEAEMWIGRNRDIRPRVVPSLDPW